MDTPPLVVIGAGAAGLMAALFAARAGAPTVLIERTRRGGKKIVVSGGGRCNVLPAEVDVSRFVTDGSANTLRRILRSWPLPEQRRFFEDDLGIALAQEGPKLFPVSNRATDVRDGLVDAVRRAGAKVRFDTSVTGVAPADGGWTVETDAGAVRARAVVLATGGLSVPKTGSDGFGLGLARRLGHTMVRTYPALTPLTSGEAFGASPHADLSGVSLTASVAAPGAGGIATRGGFLFTHRGYSGPAVLDVSHLTTLSRERGDGSQRVEVAWTDRSESDWDAVLQQHGPEPLSALLRADLPTRLADALLAETDVPPDRTRAELRRDERRRLARALGAYRLPWTGDEGYKKAEVTGGGVALNQVHPGTMESRRAPGLYLCGEVLDAFGPIGGYNFLWAWATGRLAGLSAARTLQAAPA